jgi:hypothetical protein
MLVNNNNNNNNNNNDNNNNNNNNNNNLVAYWPNPIGGKVVPLIYYYEKPWKRPSCLSTIKLVLSCGIWKDDAQTIIRRGMKGRWSQKLSATLF